MSYIAGVKLLLVYALLSLACGEKPEESFKGVEDLTPDNFDKLVDGSRLAFVEFYAPWCGHCKSVAAELKKLGGQVLQDGELRGKVVVGKVNADKYKDLGSRFGVRGFPTFKVFPRGSTDPEDYSSGRTASAFLDYLKQQVAADKSYGRVPLLDDLAATWSNAPDPSELLSQAQAKLLDVTEDARDNAAIYIKYMQNSITKGKDYLGGELTRIGKIIESKSVAPEKLQELLRKQSILQAFQGFQESKDKE